MSMRKRCVRRLATATLLGAAVFPSLAGNAHAQGVDTRIRVRVVSHDAKIIGSGVGGARVTIRNADSGETLAQGIQEGSTGDTESIVVKPVERGGTV